MLFRSKGTDILKINEENYQKSIKNKLSGIDPSKILPTINLDPANYRPEAPKPNEFRLSPTEWHPTIVDKSMGIVLGSDSTMGGLTSQTMGNQANAYKLWKQTRTLPGTDLLFGENLAVAIDSPTFKEGDAYKPGGWEQYRSSKRGYMGPMVDKLDQGITGKILRGSELDEAQKKNTELYNLYLNTLDLLAGNMAYTTTGGPGAELQNKLAELMNGQPFVELNQNEISPLNLLQEKGAQSAIIAQSSLEQSFMTALESAVANPAMAGNKKFGFLAGFPAGKDKAFDLGMPFRITDKNTGVFQSFPIMINGSKADLAGFEEEAKRQSAKNKGKVSSTLETDNIKLALPMSVGGKKAEIAVPIVYENYKGVFFDPQTNNWDDTRPIDTFLPTPAKSALFQTLDVSQRRLFTPKKYNTQDILNASSFKPGTPIIQELEKWHNMVLNKDPAADQQKARVVAGLSLDFPAKTSLVKNLAGVGGGVDAFTNISDNPLSVNVGDFILEKLEALKTTIGTAAGKVDTSTIKKGVVLSDAELPQAVTALIRGSMALFGGLRLPGLPDNWLQRMGATQAIRVANTGNPRGAAQYMMSLLNEAGGGVSRLQNMATTIPVYNQLSNIHTMISGAAAAFGSIAGGDTALLKQIVDKGDISVAALFRSLGGMSKFGKISSMTLSPDWQNILGNQLVGTKIKTVGRGGDLTEVDLSDAIPENASVNDLIKTILNPYNEFTDTTTRANLIQKFGDDLFNLRGMNNLPYFDPQTLNFIGTGLLRLKAWYGGQGQWLGQDYLFDKKTEPDNAARVAKFMASYDAAGQQYYRDALEAHVLFGLGNAFGALPGKDWFNARSAQGFQTGGVVYAQGGGRMVNFQPRGTDTVPAMLTPGEFVVNRAATKENLPLLHAIKIGRAHV